MVGNWTRNPGDPQGSAFDSSSIRHFLDAATFLLDSPLPMRKDDVVILMPAIEATRDAKSVVGQACEQGKPHNPTTGPGALTE